MATYVAKTKHKKWERRQYKAPRRQKRSQMSIHVVIDPAHL